MGYESKFYFVEDTHTQFDKNLKLTYSQVIVMIDMCSVGDIVYNLIKNSPDTTCYFYADDGNTKIVEDKYGKKLTEINIDELLKVVEKEIIRSTYRRYFTLLSLLKHFKNNKDYEDLKILHFGY